MVVDKAGTKPFFFFLSKRKSDSDLDPLDPCIIRFETYGFGIRSRMFGLEDSDPRHFSWFVEDMYTL